MKDRFSQDIIRLLPNLRRFAISLCRSHDQADDLVQLTAERAFAARRQFDPSTRLEPWLFRILRNAWIDMARRNASRGSQVDIADVPDAASVDGERSAEAALMLRAVDAAMKKLGEDHRMILHLVCVEELSYSEAAEVLDIPKGTVMSRLARARLALAEELGIK